MCYELIIANVDLIMYKNNINLKLNKKIIIKYKHKNFNIKSYNKISLEGIINYKSNNYQINTLYKYFLNLLKNEDFNFSYYKKDYIKSKNNIKIIYPYNFELNANNDDDDYLF